MGGEDRAEVHQGLPTLPRTGLQEGDQGPPGATLGSELAEALTTAWPDCLDLLVGWHSRHPQRYRPEERRARVTYHVSPTGMKARRREADLTGASNAAEVNRALRPYFAGKAPSEVLGKGFLCPEHCLAGYPGQ